MKQSHPELLKLCQNRNLVTRELHQPNAWYGHSYSMKKFAGLPDGYTIKGVIEHAPVIGGHVHTFEIEPALPTMFLTGKYRSKALRTRTSKAFFYTGSNLTYSPHILSQEELARERTRLGRTLLVIPIHSTHHIHADLDIEGYCADLEELGKQFNSVQVCLYWKDILRGWNEVFESRGFEVVSAGHMFDPLFLSRLKSIIDPATVVTVNHVGTQVGYAVQMGKPVFFLGNQQIGVSLAPDGNAKHMVEYHHPLIPEKIALKNEMLELRDDVSPGLYSIVQRFWALNTIDLQ